MFGCQFKNCRKTLLIFFLMNYFLFVDVWFMCTLPDEGAGNQTQVLWESSKLS